MAFHHIVCQIIVRIFKIDLLFIISSFMKFTFSFDFGFLYLMGHYQQVNSSFCQIVMQNPVKFQYVLLKPCHYS